MSKSVLHLAEIIKDKFFPSWQARLASMGRSIQLFSSSSFAQQAFSLYPTHVGSLKPLLLLVVLLAIAL